MTPFDREDIYRLIHEFDDIIDLLENTIHNIYLYEMTEKKHFVNEFARLHRRGDRRAQRPDQGVLREAEVHRSHLAAHLRHPQPRGRGRRDLRRASGSSSPRRRTPSRSSSGRTSCTPSSTSWTSSRRSATRSRASSSKAADDGELEPRLHRLHHRRRPGLRLHQRHARRGQLGGDDRLDPGPQPQAGGHLGGLLQFRRLPDLRDGRGQDDRQGPDRHLRSSIRWSSSPASSAPSPGTS